jgi:hypothetical protein
MHHLTFIVSHPRTCVFKAPIDVKVHLRTATGMTETGMERIRELWEREMHKAKNSSRIKHQEQPVCIGIKSRTWTGQRYRQREDGDKERTRGQTSGLTSSFPRRSPYFPPHPETRAWKYQLQPS